MATSRKARAVDPAIVLRRLGLLVMIAAWVFVAASLIGFDPKDPPTHAYAPANNPVTNWCGAFGAVTSYTLIKLLGHGSYVLTILVGIGLFAAAMSPPAEKFWNNALNACVRLLGLCMLTGAVSGFQNLVFPSSGPFPRLAGGQLGVVGVQELFTRFGSFGSGVVLLLMGIIGAVVCMDEWVVALTSWTWRVARERGIPTAKVAGVAAGGAALQGGALAARATARATKKAGGGLFAAISALFTRREEQPQIRETDLDDADAPGAAKLRMERAARAAAARVNPRRAPAEIVEPKPAPDDQDDAREDEDEIEPLDETTITVDEDEDDEMTAEERALAENDADDGDEDEDQGEDDAPGAPQVYDAAALRAKIAKLPIVFGQQNKAIATDADLQSLRSIDELEGPAPAPTLAAGDAEPGDDDAPAEPPPPPKPYVFPGMGLLADPEENFNSKLEESVREQAQALESALQQYRIEGNVVGIESGPVITLYDVRLAPGTKVAQIQAVSSDIARALKAVNIRIVPNQIGRDTIGIEVPNAEKEKVRLKELMAQTEKFSGMKLPMFLGKDASGEPLLADLTQMPHMLIAGTTGSGKSVCMNTIIMGFLYTKKPNELKMVLVDPKMVEMSQFKDIPHLMCPVVTEMGKAAAILEWACGKMDERYELLAEAGCRDIAAYNDLPWEELRERFNPKSPEEEARIPRKLPYMVFIIDELADLMMTNKEVESHIIRIAQKARAVGIHLILATQRPQANVVTGLIKSNMPCRISFKVASGMDSRIVLDQKGGELLLGHGDMLFLSPRSSKLMRAQGTLVDDAEIRRVVRFMREVSGPSFERQLLQIRRAEPGNGLGGLSDEERLHQSQNNSSASLAAAQEDPLFPRAVEIVLETRRGSVSLLQRRLAIGYTRASRLIDLMGIAGIISDHKGSVARDVLITIEDWEAMKKLAREQGVSLDAPTASAPAPTQGKLFEPEEADESGEDESGEDAPFDTNRVDTSPEYSQEDDGEEEVARVEGESEDDGVEEGEMENTPRSS